MPRVNYPKRSAKEIEAIGHAYQRTAERIAHIIKRLGLCNTSELYMLVKREGWRKRGQNAAGLAGRIAQASGARRGPYRGAAEWAADQRRSEAARESAMYGDDLKAVRLLQRRGFFVALDKGGYRFEGRTITSSQLRERAARETRLTGVR